MTASGAAHEAIGDGRSFALIADGMPARGADRDAGNHGLFRRVLLGALARRIYDLPLFGPLWIETRMRAAAHSASAHAAADGQSWKGART